MTFGFSNNKNRKLFEERGITFQDVIEAISEKGILKYFLKLSSQIESLCIYWRKRNDKFQTK